MLGAEVSHPVAPAAAGYVDGTHVCLRVVYDPRTLATTYMSGTRSWADGRVLAHPRDETVTLN